MTAALLLSMPAGVWAAHDSALTWYRGSSETVQSHSQANKLVVRPGYVLVAAGEDRPWPELPEPPSDCTEDWFRFYWTNKRKCRGALRKMDIALSLPDGRLFFNEDLVIRAYTFDPYVTIGCGGKLASAAMCALLQAHIRPSRACKLAIEAACAKDTHCKTPVRVRKVF